MTGIWLVSYIVLWALVVAGCLFMVGMMRQLGLMHVELARHRAEQPQDEVPAPENDGPGIGSPIVDFDRLPINGGEIEHRARPAEIGRSLVIFMSPMCELCHRIVDAVNAVASDHAENLPVTVVMRGDGQSCRAFLSIFPLRAPVFSDEDSSLTMQLGIHRIPFGLVYERGVLVRKGTVETGEELSALLGHPAAAAPRRLDGAVTGAR